MRLLPKISMLLSVLAMSACVSDTTSTLTRETFSIPETPELVFSPRKSGVAQSTPSQAPQPVPYDPLISSKTQTRQITGVALAPHKTAPFLRSHTVSGAIARDGRDFSFTDTIFSLTDADGPNSKGEFSNGTLKLVTDQASYKYAARYAIDDGNRATAGIFGIATQPTDMPQKGTATYRGFGEITEIYPSTIPGIQPRIINHVASSELDVNFATGKVNAALKVQSRAVQIGSQIDRVSARGMQISGSGFSGSTVKLFNNGARVYPTGANASAQASGQFFGAKRTPDATLTPAEVGGVLHSSSKDGFVFGTFIAK